MRLIIFCIALSPFLTLAQRNVQDSIIGTPLVGVHYGAMWSGGDLADRYTFFNHVGIMAGYKSNRNVFLGMDANFMFGNQINADESTDEFYGLFDHLTDSYGNITDANGDIAKVLVYSRGININATVGYIIPVFSPNKNSGVMIQIGAGYLAHKLRVETQDQVVPQLELDYKRGYDRLTIGPNLHEFLGYSFMSNGGYYNFYGGFYAQQGFTQNRRDQNYDKPNVPVSQDTRMDLQFGIKAGWFIPFYKRQPKDYYFD